MCVCVCLKVCGSEGRGGLSLSLWYWTKQNVSKQARDLSASWPASRRNNAHTNAEGQYRRDYVTDSRKDSFSLARTHSLFGSSLVAPRAHMPEEDCMTRISKHQLRIAGQESLFELSISADVGDQGIEEECRELKERSSFVQRVKVSLACSADVRNQGALSSISSLSSLSSLSFKEECGDWKEGSGPVVQRVSLQQRLEVGGERGGVDGGGRRRGGGRGCGGAGSADEYDGSVGEWRIQTGLVR
jgi:hypothetical protein